MAAAAATGTGDREATTSKWSDATNRRTSRRRTSQDRRRFRSKAQGRETATARKEERRYSCWRRRAATDRESKAMDKREEKGAGRRCWAGDPERAVNSARKVAASHLCRRIHRQDKRLLTKSSKDIGWRADTLMLLRNDLTMTLLATLKKVKLPLLFRHRQPSQPKPQKRRRNETYRALFYINNNEIN